MWKRVHPQKAENDEGVSVESGGRFSNIYSEGNRKMSFATEGGRDKDGHYVESIRWDLPLRWNPPHETEILTDEETQRIRTNLSDGLACLGARAIFSK